MRRELLERDLEPVCTDDGGMEAGSDRAQLFEGSGDLTPCRPQPRRRVVVPGESFLEQTQLQGEGDEALLRPVVQVALEPLPFLLPRFDYARTRARDLLEPRAQLDVKPPRSRLRRRP